MATSSSDSWAAAVDCMLEEVVASALLGPPPQPQSQSKRKQPRASQAQATHELQCNDEPEAEVGLAADGALLNERRAPVQRSSARPPSAAFPPV